MPIVNVNRLASELTPEMRFKAGTMLHYHTETLWSDKVGCTLYTLIKMCENYTHVHFNNDPWEFWCTHIFTTHLGNSHTYTSLAKVCRKINSCIFPPFVVPVGVLVGFHILLVWVHLFTRNKTNLASKPALSTGDITVTSSPLGSKERTNAPRSPLMTKNCNVYLKACKALWIQRVLIISKVNSHWG